MNEKEKRKQQSSLFLTQQTIISIAFYLFLLITNLNFCSKKKNKKNIYIHLRTNKKKQIQIKQEHKKIYISFFNFANKQKKRIY